MTDESSPESPSWLNPQQQPRPISGELDTIEPPRQQWADVEKVIACVSRMEAYVTAERDSDLRSTVFFDGVIDEQRQSEHEAAYLLGRMKFAASQPSALMIIDARLREQEAKPASLQSWKRADQQQGRDWHPWPFIGEANQQLHNGGI